MTPGGSLPFSTTFATGGTCHQVTPVAQMLAASVRTTGVPSAAPRRTDSNANRCHDQRAGNDVALLHHHLMRNAGAGRVEIDAVLARERLDLGVLPQILRRDILNVVIDGEHRLRRIRDRRRANLLELRHDRAGVVVRHHMARTNRDEIPRAHDGCRQLVHRRVARQFSRRV